MTKTVRSKDAGAAGCKITSGRLKRQSIWKHNSFLGHAVMTQKNMYAIAKSETATEKAKTLASEIYILAERLEQALRDRVEGNLT